MATLSQLLAQRYGNLSSGDRFKRQASLYKGLGGAGSYSGSLAQNSLLLKNQNRWDSLLKPKAVAKPAAAKAVAAPRQSAIAQAPLRTADQFEKLYGKFGNFFNSDRAVSGERARAERFYLPQLQRQQESINEDFANRGLLRSGIRGKSNEMANQDAYEQIDSMIQQQSAAREQESRDIYNEQLKKYLADTTVGGYKPPADFTPDNTPYEDTFNVEELTADPYAAFGRGFEDIRKRSLATKFRPEYKVGIGSTPPGGSYLNLLG